MTFITSFALLWKCRGWRSFRWRNQAPPQPLKLQRATRSPEHSANKTLYVLESTIIWSGVLDGEIRPKDVNVASDMYFWTHARCTCGRTGQCVELKRYPHKWYSFEQSMMAISIRRAALQHHPYEVFRTFCLLLLDWSMLCWPNAYCLHGEPIIIIQFPSPIHHCPLTARTGLVWCLPLTRSEGRDVFL
jgi:hypothetical protein